MAKTYIDIVKYMVEARFEISGLVEKPDIIGAVFGQTEGLLGGDLDLRELQKNGKIGRIEIDTNSSGNRTFGKLHLPSSLGRIETCILAAAIESVDRVGPFETNFKIDKIEDTRSEKRKKIVNRAKELVKLLMTTEIPDSREISEQVEGDVKSSVITTYGVDNLPAGPEVAASDDVILVEGRADVVNLLKNDIANCVAVGGAAGTIPKTITDLMSQKETTLFLDGDRGGDIILKALMNAGEVDFVARAPDGKEVEELTRKEIIKSLRSRVPIEQMFPALRAKAEQRHARLGAESEERNTPPRMNMAAPQPQRPPQQQAMRPSGARPQQSQQYRTQQSQILSPTAIANNLAGKAEKEEEKYESFATDDLDIKDLREGAGSKAPSMGIPTMGAQKPAQQAGAVPGLAGALDELHNTLRGRLYGQNGELMSEIPIRELIQAIQDTKGIRAIVFDGIITQRLVELAYKSGVKEIYGIRANQITRTYEGMLLYTKEHGKL